MEPGLEQGWVLPDEAATARAAIKAWEMERVDFDRQTTRQAAFPIKAEDDRVTLGKPIAEEVGLAGVAPIFTPALSA